MSEARFPTRAAPGLATRVLRTEAAAVEGLVARLASTGTPAGVLHIPDLWRTELF